MDKWRYRGMWWEVKQEREIKVRPRRTKTIIQENNSNLKLGTFF